MHEAVSSPHCDVWWTPKQLVHIVCHLQWWVAIGGYRLSLAILSGVTVVCLAVYTANDHDVVYKSDVFNTQVHFLVLGQSSAVMSICFNDSGIISSVVCRD